MTWFEDQDPIVQSVIIACGTYITKGIAAWWADRKEKQNLDTAGRNEKEKLDKEREVQRTRTVNEVGRRLPSPPSPVDPGCYD